MENIQLDVAQVIGVIGGIRSSDPEAAKRATDILRLCLNREGFQFGDLETALKPLFTVVGNIFENQKTIFNKLGDVMKEIEDMKAQAAQNTAAMQKSLGELRATVDKANESQASIDARIAAAVAAARAGDLEATRTELAALKVEQDKQTVILADMDAQVPDAVVEPTEPPVEPTEPPVEPAEPVTPTEPVQRRR